MKSSLFIALFLFIQDYAADNGTQLQPVPPIPAAPIAIPFYQSPYMTAEHHGRSPRVTAATPPGGATPARTPRNTPPKDYPTLEAMTAALQAQKNK